MPRRHDELVVGDIVKASRRDVRPIDAIVPRTALCTPSHHVEAARFDQPFAYPVLPVGRNSLFKHEN